jgi:hypothetical protein
MWTNNSQEAEAKRCAEDIVPPDRVSHKSDENINYVWEERILLAKRHLILAQIKAHQLQSKLTDGAEQEIRRLQRLSDFYAIQRLNLKRCKRSKKSAGDSELALSSNATKEGSVGDEGFSPKGAVDSKESVTFASAGKKKKQEAVESARDGKSSSGKEQEAVDSGPDKESRTTWYPSLKKKKYGYFTGSHMCTTWWWVSWGIAIDWGGKTGEVTAKPKPKAKKLHKSQVKPDSSQLAPDSFPPYGVVGNVYTTKK